MTKTNENLEIESPKNQLYLYGYEYYFNSFIKLYRENKLPNTILSRNPKCILAIPSVILRVTNSIPLLSDSWLNNIPLTLNIS